MIMTRSRIYTKTGDDGTTGLLHGVEQLIDDLVAERPLRPVFVVARHAAGGAAEPASHDERFASMSCDSDFDQCRPLHCGSVFAQSASQATIRRQSRKMRA